MPEEKSKKEKEVLDVNTVEPDAVAFINNITTIPNSTSEFCIYTYKAEFESYNQLMRPGFFDTTYSFVVPGDIIRVFRFDYNKKLTHYLEFVVMDVDKVAHKVTVAGIQNHNLEKKII